ncbi:MAG: Peptidase [Hyphomicrobiales bacterium]|nr:Peptidase [Hyphomicrobiales bacterium]
MIQMTALIAFPLMMAYAASSDLLTMTIPNLLSALLVAGYLALALMVGAPLETIALHLSCGAGVLAITFTLFCLGWVGGGDAKLAAATAIWTGWSSVVEYALVAAMFGGALTLFLLALRKWPLPASLLRQAWLVRLHDHQSGVPYGIALAAAGLFIYPHTPLWSAATGG